MLKYKQVNPNVIKVLCVKAEKMKVNDSQNSNSINNKKNPVIKILIGTAKFKTTITPTSNNTKEMIIISNE